MATREIGRSAGLLALVDFVYGIDVPRTTSRAGQFTATSLIQSYVLPFRPSAFAVVVGIPALELLISGCQDVEQLTTVVCIEGTGCLLGRKFSSTDLHPILLPSNVFLITTHLPRSRQSTDTTWACSITYPEFQALRFCHASFACTPPGPRVCSPKSGEAVFCRAQWYWPRASAGCGHRESPTYWDVPFAVYEDASFHLSSRQCFLESPSSPHRTYPESTIAITETSCVFPHGGLLARRARCSSLLLCPRSIICVARKR